MMGCVFFKCVRCVAENFQRDVFCCCCCCCCVLFRVREGLWFHKSGNITRTAGTSRGTSDEVNTWALYRRPFALASIAFARSLRVFRPRIAAWILIAASIFRD